MIEYLKYSENNKNPTATKKKRKAKAANGSLLSMIGLVVINADDQRIIKTKGKILIILKNDVKHDELPQYFINIKAYFGQSINCGLWLNQISLSGEFKIF